MSNFTHIFFFLIALFHASPSLRVKVFWSVGDVILLIFSHLSAFLVLWSIFLILPVATPLSTYHCREHLLVDAWKSALLIPLVSGHIVGENKKSGKCLTK